MSDKYSSIIPKFKTKNLGFRIEKFFYTMKNTCFTYSELSAIFNTSSPSICKVIKKLIDEDKLEKIKIDNHMYIKTKRSLNEI